jgi:hypothetical protein
MKSVLIVVVSALAVVALYLLTARTEGRGGVMPEIPGPERARRFDGPRSAEEIVAERDQVWPRSGPTSVSTGLPGPDAANPELWQRVRTLIQATKGRDVRLIDRALLTRQNWELEQRLDAEGIAYLLEKYAEETDPSFRWSLSWLMERIKDDRMIEPLCELMEHHPMRAADALASLGSERSLGRLAELVPEIDDPRVRAHAYVRIGQSPWSEAERYLSSVWRDSAASDLERLAAIEALSNRDGTRESTRLAMEVALGPPVPLRGLGERGLSHPEADLRSGAIMATMRLGDLAAVRQLLGAAEDSGADPALVRMVDHHLAGYQGPEISRLVFDRIGRRGRVSAGEARYLLRTATASDVTRLQRLHDTCGDPEVRRLLDAALTAARDRP